MGCTTAIGYTPAFSITKGDEEVTSAFADRLISTRVCSYEGGGDADTVDIEIDDRDWTITEPSIGEGAATLSVSLGYAETVLYDMGTFDVGELHHKWMPKAMTLHGNSAGSNTNMKSPVITSYDGKTVGEVVGQIAQAGNFTASVDPSLSSIEIPYLNQHCSFSHMLAELERRFDATAKFQDGILSFTKRDTEQSVSGLDLGMITLYPEYVQNG